MSRGTRPGSGIRAGTATLAGLGVYVLGMLVTVMLAGAFADGFLSLGDAARAVVLVIAFTLAAGAAGLTTALMLRDAGTSPRTGLVLVALWPAVFGVVGLFDARADGEPAWQGPVVLVTGVAAALLVGGSVRRR